MPTKPIPTRRRAVRLPVTDVLATRSRRILSSSTAASSTPKPREVPRKVDIPVDTDDISEMFVDALRALPKATRTRRDGDYLHVSELLGQCLRKAPLAAHFGQTIPDEELPEGLALTFETGEAIHDFVKRRFVGMRRMTLYGNWTCKCGGKVLREATVADALASGVCPKCNHMPTDYEELCIENDELLITGSPDIVLFLEKYRAYMPVEIKSIEHVAWTELARPIPDHLLQDLFYWYLMRERGYPMLPCMVILYVTKGYSHNRPYKPFFIDPLSILDRLDPYIEEALARKVAIAAGKIPPRVLCKSATVGEAKTCPMRVPCFDEAVDANLSHRPVA